MLGLMKPKEDALQTMMNRIYDELRRRGVPDVRLPEPQALISHIMLWVDKGRMDEWIDGFARLEGLNDAPPAAVIGTPTPAADALVKTGEVVNQAAGTAASALTGAATSILNSVKKVIGGES